MLTLPDEYSTLPAVFQSQFSKRLWPLVRVLLVGAILAPGIGHVLFLMPALGLAG